MRKFNDIRSSPMFNIEKSLLNISETLYALQEENDRLKLQLKFKNKTNTFMFDELKYILEGAIGVYDAQGCASFTTFSYLEDTDEICIDALDKYFGQCSWADFENNEITIYVPKKSCKSILDKEYKFKLYAPYILG